MAVGQPVENVCEISFWIETIELRRLDERVENGGSVSACIGADEKKILACNGNSSEQPLGAIIVDIRMAVCRFSFEASLPS